MALSAAPTREPITLENGAMNPKWVQWFHQTRKQIEAVDYSGKADIVGGAPDGLLARLDADGNLVAVTDLTQYIGSADIQVNDDGDGTLTLQYDAEGKGFFLLASTSLNGQTTTKQTVYTVPTGKTLVPWALCVRGLSASLAGLTDMDIGGDVDAGDWLQQISLDDFTAVTDFGWIKQPEQAAGPPIVPVKKTVYAAGTAFGVKINTGSTGAATFTAELVGYLV